MRYVSFCSGVEAASLAWTPLGWEAVAFSEIEPFPCAVLKERFPNVPNLGDMTKIKCLDNKKGIYQYGTDGTVCELGPVDLFVGGTPCQSFSVAGNRSGLRGVSGLSLTYCELLKSVQPEWFVWENVPGVFSTNNGEDFKTLIRAFDEVGYSCAWRVLDTQFVRTPMFPRAIPQRRRRVFVVGHLGADWRYPAEVLFEREGLFGNPPPRRIKGQGFTAGIEGGVGDAGKGAVGSRDIYCRAGDDGRAETMREVCPTQQCYDGAVPIIKNAATVTDRAGKPGGGKGPLDADERSLTLNTGNTQKLVQMETKGCDTYNGSVSGDVAPTITNAEGVGSHSGAKVLSIHKTQHPIVNEEVGHPLGAVNNGLENTVLNVIDDQGGGRMHVSKEDVSHTMRAQTKHHEPMVQYGVDAYNQTVTGDVSMSMTAKSSDAHHVPTVVEFDAYQQQATGDIAQTLKASRADNEHMPTVCYPINEQEIGRRLDGSKESLRVGLGVGKDGDPTNTLGAAHCHAVATFAQAGFGNFAESEVGATIQGDGDSRGNSHLSAVVKAVVPSGYGEYKDGEVAGVLTGDHDNRVTSGNCALVHEAFAIPSTIIGRDEGKDDKVGWKAEEGVANTAHSWGVQGVAETFPIEGNGSRPSHRGDGYGKPGSAEFTLNTTEVHGVATRSSVRRITPTEAERLMGFPHDWTRIPWRGKPAEECPDGPRYKCCGNSMSVNCMEWLGMRIELVERITGGN